MPAIPIVIALGSFGAGFLTGSSTSKLIKLGLIGGGGFLAYKAFKGA
ncbi:hypothetical protein ABXV22_24420 [Vibrio rotiferianus]|nr:hypothetical protein [Vibrio rotiferianus]